MWWSGDREKWPATWAMGSLSSSSSTAETDGLLGVSLVTEPPGIATPLHRDTREAEAFLVLEGRVKATEP